MACFGFLGEAQHHSQIVISFDGSVNFAFSQLARYSAPSKIRLDEVKVPDSSPLVVIFNRGLLEKWDFIKVVPHPPEVSANEPGLEYHFDTLANKGAHIDFDINNQTVGSAADALMIQSTVDLINRFMLH